MLENRELYDNLINSVREVLVMSQTAALCGVTKQQLSSWLIKGKKEREEEPESPTIFANFHRDYNRALAVRVSELMDNIGQAKKGWQGSAWLLERCLREDFGSDAAKMAEISEEIAGIRGIIEKLKKSEDIYDNKPAGDSANANEV